jgi:hypothetical protein
MAVVFTCCDFYNEKLEREKVKEREVLTELVTTIYKKGTRCDPGNYRPVSFTSVPCKILESLIREKIMDHHMKNNLIQESQHKFMHRSSCSTNLISFLDSLIEVRAKGKVVDMIYQILESLL